MSEIVTEHSGSILSIQFNRPEKKNALTMSMYDTVAELLNAAAGDDGIRVVLLHGAGDSFSAGNDLGDFLKNPPKGYDSPQGRFIDALNNFDQRLIEVIQRIDEAALRTVIPLGGILQEITEVVARAEGISGPVQQHDPYSIVSGRSVEQLRHRVVHAHRQSVLLLRTVELNTQDASGVLRNNLTHGRP